MRFQSTRCAVAVAIKLFSLLLWRKSRRRHVKKSYTFPTIWPGVGKMGNEATCKVRFGKQLSEGKALLETSEILFRGGFRLKIPFSTIKSAKAVDGELRLQTAEGLAIFHVGVAAEKWCDKILHPKSRIEKLGIKPEASVSLTGKFEPDFLAELSALTKSVSKDKVA